MAGMAFSKIVASFQTVHLLMLCLLFTGSAFVPLILAVTNFAVIDTILQNTHAGSLNIIIFSEATKQVAA